MTLSLLEKILVLERILVEWTSPHLPMPSVEGSGALCLQALPALRPDVHDFRGDWPCHATLLVAAGARKARWRRWIAITAGGLIASDGSRDAVACHTRHFTECA